VTPQITVVNDAADSAGRSQAADEKRRLRLMGLLMAISWGIGFSGFLVLVLASYANSRFVANVGLSQFLVPFLFVGSWLMVSAFTKRRKALRTRLGQVAIGLLIVVPAIWTGLGIWFG
jgi:hypothetical protein